ncbi:MAG: peptidylprolyl isomerase [Flavobacteriales bacterium]
MNNFHVPTIFAGMALMLACGSSPAPTKTEVLVNEKAVEKPQKPVKATVNNDLGEGLFAIITTRLGTITCKLDYEGSPLTVANFVALAEGKQHNTAKPDGTPFYDGTIFHRVIPGFMIQGGDPTGTGSGGPGYKFPDELDPSTELYKAGYVRGTMAMANSGPNTNGSQFFIMHQDYGLQHNYSIFGMAVSGMETVDAIAALPRNPRDRPNEDVSMTVKIKAVGKAAKAYDAVKVLQANKAKFIPR